MRIIAPKHNNVKFLWDFSRFVGIAEISDFGHKTVWGRIYDDSQEVGFVVILESGEEAVFSLIQTEKRDGDTVAWHFKAVPGSVMGEWSIVIFND